MYKTGQEVAGQNNVSASYLYVVHGVFDMIWQRCVRNETASVGGRIGPGA